MNETTQVLEILMGASLPCSDNVTNLDQIGSGTIRVVFYGVDTRTVCKASLLPQHNAGLYPIWPEYTTIT